MPPPILLFKFSYSKNKIQNRICKTNMTVYSHIPNSICDYHVALHSCIL